MLFDQANADEMIYLDYFQSLSYNAQILSLFPLFGVQFPCCSRKKTQSSISATFHGILHSHESLDLCIWGCMTLRQGWIIELWKWDDLLVKPRRENIRNGIPVPGHEICTVRKEKKLTDLYRYSVY